MDNSNATLSDYIIPDIIDDTMEQIRFIPSKNAFHLASVGWDCRLRVWNLSYSPSGMQGTTAQIQSSLIFNNQLPDPLLSLSWQGESTNIFTGSCDGTINMFDLNQGKNIPVGKHEIGCKELIWVPGFNCLLSGGWDGQLCFWDLRQQTPVLNYNLGKKVYTMSLSNSLLVVGMEGRTVSYFNLQKAQQRFAPEATFESHLKYQTRCISTFPEGDGYAIGSIEGRVAIKYVDLNKQPEINPETKSMNAKDDFAFRCHRSGEQQSEVFPVNSIAFNLTYGTFCTGGGDGSWIIWDKDSRSRLKQGFHSDRAPITALDYSGNGDLMAYASGYDWAKGIAYENSCQPKLTIHYCPDSDKKKKPKK